MAEEVDRFLREGEKSQWEGADWSGRVLSGQFHPSRDGGLQCSMPTRSGRT